MANFQVPQFIETKAKILGPLTLQQFLYVGAGAGLILLTYYLFNFFIWILTAIIITALTLSFAFLKINGQPMPQLFIAALAYFLKPRVYTWQRMIEQTAVDISAIEKLENIRKNVSIQDKLKSIALNITTGKLLSPQELRKKSQQEETSEKYQMVTYLTGEKRLAKRVDY